MPHADNPHPSYSEPEVPASGAINSDPLVELEWAVPTAAKVPAPRQRVSVATITMRPVCVTSTVPPETITELRANNTVLPTRWCTTATLTARRPARLAR